MLTGSAAGTLAGANYVNPINIILLFVPVGARTDADTNRMIGEVLVRRQYVLRGRTAS